MFGKKGLFGNNIDPACGYCEFGKPTSDGSMILCPKTGIIAPSYSCKRFSYNPLLRVPKSQQELPRFDKSEFEL